ncbi:hydrogenase maturation nickel metallochaperone HypA [Campylobacter cuniculorum]|uniref:Hydrogenase maturation factor HypA n=2 Tax=Campylobacter cuniculorum TaxID=374106 RepID=A0A1W6BYF3_9BACT|nr:hydrogenase maturation nickel metallochaperone HypA [Campylobacter cuniculorum]ARJ57070.1 hydrogenase nickel insertion protein HypA [Campylobacter cuniculorum DSM 23162 = LMG 24588]QOR04515.1 hydrogenase maturation nickel metallochaperone HypA [Campylobacter cuniculorum]
MHELSIVQSLIELCEQNALNHNAKLIKEVQVKIGRLSGVEPELFQRCFETFKESCVYCKEAKLTIQNAELEILCLSCHKESILKENVFKCPHCQSIDFKILSGEDLHLMRLVME